MKLWAKILLGLFLGVLTGVFLPSVAVFVKPMGDLFIRAIKMLIVTHNFCDMKDMGKLMGEFNKEYGGKADNKVVSQIVRNILK